MTSRRRFCRVLEILTLVVFMAGCVAPGPNEGGYSLAALRTVQASISATATAALVIENVEDGRIFGPYARVTLSEAENSIHSVQSIFSAIQPTPDQLQLRRQVTEAVSQAAEAIADARIAVRFRDNTGLPEALSDLQKSSDVLNRLEASLQ